MELDTISAATATPQNEPRGLDALRGEDFLKLLVTQLTNQDPLAPTSNEQLLEQLASIRDIQLSTSLTEVLQTLTGNQRYGSAAALMGMMVTGRVVDDQGRGQEISGVVVGVNFSKDGQVELQLETGQSLPLENLASVVEPNQAADSLIGQLVRGVNRDESGDAEVIEGIVTGVRTNGERGTELELDTGEVLLLSDLVAAA
jgi:flagellar basal-body rod modification protein FlgD